MTDPAIETAGLRKVFGGRTVAVDGLTLEVGRGEVFGFLGPNGAGKTTTIKILLGLVRPTAGEARVLRHAPGEADAMRRIGFLPEHFRFPAWLQAAEFLDLHARLHGMSGERRRSRIPELLERVGLADRGSTRLGDFSKGMSQRVGLAQALLNNPSLVILDEPTSGLDPLGRREVMDMIRELRAKGTTVFLNSHLLSEVEATCDRVAVIRRGRIARIGSLEELAGTQLEIEVRASAITPGIRDTIARLGGRVVREDEGGGGEEPANLVLVVRDSRALPEIARAIVEGGGSLYRFSPRRLSLEEMFVRIMEEEG